VDDADNNAGIKREPAPVHREHEHERYTPNPVHYSAAPFDPFCPSQVTSTARIPKLEHSFTTHPQLNLHAPLRIFYEI
jgi:hypothetical protein